MNWNHRFIEMAELVASWSKDPSTKCGAVIVRPDKTVCSVGFNGFPMGCDDDPETYADRERKYARIIHAEANALLMAREPLHGYTMYNHPASCDRCAALIIQAGISRVVHRRPSAEFWGRWGEPIQRAMQMYEEAGVQVVQLREDT